MRPLPYQACLQSFYLSLFPDTLSSWISNYFFKPFSVFSEKINTLRRDSWEEISIYPTIKWNQTSCGELRPIWDLYFLLPFLFLLPKDSFFGRSIREENNCYFFTVSFKNSDPNLQNSNEQFRLFSVKIDIQNPRRTNVVLYRSGLSLYNPKTSITQTPSHLDIYGKLRKKVQLIEFVSYSFSLKPNDDLLSFQSNGISPLVKDSFIGTVFSTVLEAINKSQEKINKKPAPFTLNSIEKIFISDEIVLFSDFNEMLIRNFGHFQFYLSPSLTKDPFPVFDIEPEKGRVESMVYISSEAKSLINHIQFRCIILDATFKLIPGFVVSLVSGIIFNSYIPLGFTISHSENSELYQHFYQTFFDQTQFNLATFPVLSDRHTGIRSFCVHENIQQFYCIVHLLRSFGGKHHLLYAMKKLLYIEQKADVPKFLHFLSQNLVSDLNDSTIVGKLKSIGLAVIDGEILIDENSPLFSQCCAAYRLESGIPLCTNSIESVHGHLNESIPRHNCYFHGCATLIQRINNRFKIIRKYLQSKLMQHYKKIDKDAESIAQDVMIDLRNRYSTTPENCNCGSTYRLSCFYNAKIPCIHQRSIGVQFPSLTIVDLPEFNVPLNITFNCTVSDDIETTTNPDDDTSEPPIRENEREKAYTQCTDLTRIFENIVNMIMNVTKISSREKVGRLIYKTFYDPELYEDMTEPITDRVARFGITHRCLMIVEKELAKERRENT
jgi:hypothetical protein